MQLPRATERISQWRDAIGYAIQHGVEVSEDLMLNGGVEMGCRDVGEMFEWGRAAISITPPTQKMPELSI